MKRGGLFACVLLIASGLMAWFPFADLSIDPLSLSQMTVSKTSAAVADTLTFTMVLDNQGPDAYSDASLTNTLPAGLTYVDGSLTATGGTPAYAGGVVTWTGALNVAGAVTLTYQVVVGAEAQGKSLLNTAQLTAGSIGKTLSATVIVPPLHVYLPVCLNRWSACGDFLDNFLDPASGWWVGDDAEAMATYLDGEFRIVAKSTEYIYLFKAPTCSHEHYAVEVDARWAGTTGYAYGIIFGLADDFSQYYLFAINSDYQEYALYYLDSSGELDLIVPWTYMSNILPGYSTNHLRVVQNGNQVTLEVAGGLTTVYIADITGPISGLTYAGVFSLPYSDVAYADVRYDNFSLSVLPGIQSIDTDLIGMASDPQIDFSVEMLPAFDRERPSKKNNP